MNPTMTTILSLSEQQQQQVAASSSNWELSDYVYFKKCGEITASPDEQCFGMNCIFCASTCLQFDVFMQHIREEHSQDVRALYNINKESADQATQTCYNETETESPETETEKLTEHETLKDNELALKDVPCNNNYNKTITTPESPMTRMRIKAEAAANLEVVEFQPETQDKELDEALFAYALEGAMPVSVSLPPLPLPVSVSVPVPLPLSLPLSPDHLLRDETTTITTIGQSSSSSVVSVSSVTGEENDPFEMCFIGDDGSQSQFDIDFDTDTNYAATTQDEEEDDHDDDEEDDDDDDSDYEEEDEEEDGDDDGGDNSERDVIVDKIEHPKVQIQTETELQAQLKAEAAEEAIVSSTKKTPPKRRPKNIKVRDAVHNRDIVIYLLKAYENNEKLWNPKHPQHKYNASREIFKELAAPLERDMNYKLNETEIFAVLSELRKRYREELTKCKEHKGRYKPRLWYFQNMEFLRNVIEKKRQQRAEKILRIYNNTEETMEVDSSQQTILRSAQHHEILRSLLSAFKRNEHLWNPQHADYVVYLNKEHFENISKELKEQLQVNLSSQQCFQEVQKLRTRYRRELRMMGKRKGTESKLWCFQDMEFLKKIFKDDIMKRQNLKRGIKRPKANKKFLEAEEIIFKTIEDELQFIEIYKNYPSIYDVDHPDFRSENFRNKALNQLTEEINMMLNMNATKEQLEKTLFKMRKKFSSEKSILLADVAKIKQPSMTYNKLAEFLDANVPPFRCETCNQIIRTYDKYRVHKSEHDGVHPFICTLCGKGFRSSGNLTIHIRRHRRDLPYKCDICTKKFATSTEVGVHIRTHTNERPYACDMCDKAFKTWSWLDVHRRTHLKQVNFQCTICEKGFYERNRYVDHMNRHLNVRRFACKVCDKAFTTRGNLQKHNELHAPEMKYKCTQCSKRFAQGASLRWHKRKAHTDTQYEQ